LILNNIPLVKNFAGNSQALDFSGEAPRAGPPFNKVIHKVRQRFDKAFQIKDLAFIRKARPKL
jgi:hypothetical protein